MTFIPFGIAWAVLVFVYGWDPILTSLILAVMGAVYWWFLQCRGC
jgi:hypothetical protein